MRHQMHLLPKYREMIKTGTKRIELRLYDEKRQGVEVGDEIEFLPINEEADPRDRVIGKVIGVLKYPSFKEILADFPMKMVAEEGYAEEQLLKDLEKLYTPGLQNKYGVVGFRFELVK